MDHGLLIGQAEHGPQMHGPALLVLLAFALVAGVVALVRKAAARKRSDRNPASSSDGDRLISADRVSGSDCDPVSERSEETRTPSGGRSG